MKKNDIIEKLRALPYDPSGYWVITGGAMVLYGFRDETHDIDLGCTAALADRLEADGYLTDRYPDGRREFHIGEEIEIFEDWLCDTVDAVDGVPVISVRGLTEMKRSLGREKDLRDIELIRKKLGNIE
ncbi:MAG: hypothetical protein IKN36_00630 [Clostridia bacterium]|nr:hypothetical protein [Clostridia bacterium]MBR7032821.1 hypothetical protein [Clostridia bacterium]